MSFAVAYAPEGSSETAIETRNPSNQTVLSSGATSWAFPDINVWYRFRAYWKVAGQRTTSSVVLPAETDLLWSATGSGAGSATLDLGKVDATGVYFYAKQTAYRAAGNLSQVVGAVTYGGSEPAPAAPVIASLAATSVTSTTAAVAYAVSDPNGDALTTTYAVVARGATPSSWTATASSPITKTGLTENTDYDFYLRSTDGTFTTTSAPLQFKTLEGASVAPSFSTQPRLKAGSQTSQGFTVEAGISNPGGFSLTHELSLDGGTTYYAATATLNGGSGLYEIPVTSQQSGSKSVVWKVVGGSYTIASSPAVSIATGTLTISGTLSALVGDTQVTLSGPTVNFTPAKWQRKTGAGSWVDIASTATTFPSTVVGSLTNGQSYTFTVQAVDSAGNESNDLTATQTPAAPVVGAFVNTFSAGEAINSTFIGTSVGNSGSVAAAANELKVLSVSATDAALFYLKDAVNSALTRRYTFITRTVAQGASGTHTKLGLLQKSSAPTIETSADGNPFDANRRIIVNAKTTGEIGCNYFTTGHARKSWNFTGASAGTWTTTTGDPTEYLAATAGAIHQVIFESEYNAGTPRWRIIVKSEDGTTTAFTTSWVNWSDVENVSSNPYYVWGGEQYTTAGATIDGRYKLIKCEAY